MKTLLHPLIVLFFTAISFHSAAQTTLTTGNPAATTLIATAPTGILFVLENTNSYPITITDVAVFRGSSTNNIQHELLYNPVTLSGSTNLGTDPNWQVISTVTVGTASANGIHPAFTGLSFNIPANTTYRFAVRVAASSLVIGGTSATPNTFSAGGVTLGTGNYQINSLNTGGYISNNSSTAGNYSFGGTITFAPATPCVSPPNAGTATVTNTSPCAGNPIKLDLTGSTGGLTQTYDWQVSTTSPTGPYTSIGSPTGASILNTTAPATAGTYYYRCVVDCGSVLDTSTVVSINVPAYFPGGVYTINNASPTGGSNFQTFADAATAINCGITGPITFNVSPGTYTNDRFYLDSIPNTSATNTITVNGGGATLVNTSSNTTDRATVRFYGADHVTINNLTIIAGGTGTTQYGFAVQLLSNADSNTISNCKILVDSVTASTNFTAVSISGSVNSQTTTGSLCDGNTLTGNYISGGYYGITLFGTSSASLIQNNSITNNTIRNFYNYGVYASYTNFTLVEGNDISRPNRTNTTTFAGVYFVNVSRNVSVSKNRIHNAFDGIQSSTSAAYPIYFSSADGTVGNENIISNNLVYNINNNGVIYGIYNSSSDHCKYYHNTISLDHTASTASVATAGIYQTTSATGLDFKNNIISIKRGGTGANHGIFMNTAATTYTSDNNNVYVGGASAINHFGYSGTDQTTLSAWQTTTSKDALSKDVDPVYLSALSNNYQPTNPALDNIGVFVNITTDILNASRNGTTPDIGAIEFTPPTCPPSGTLGATNITATSADLIWTPTSTATQWQVQYGPAGFTLGAGTLVNNAANPLMLTTLSPTTNYSFYVRDVCGVGDSSIWAGPFNFTTACGAITAFPWTYDVESQPGNLGTGQMTGCWTATPTPSTSAFSWFVSNNGTTSSASTGPSTAHSGTNYFFTEGSYGTTGALAELVTPQFDVTSLAALTDPMVEFYYHMYGSQTDRLVIHVFDGTTWMPVDSIMGQQQAAETDPWQLKQVVLTGYTGVIQVKFVGVRGAGFLCDMSIDDITIKAAPTCPPPSGLTASNPTSSSLDVSWITNSTASQHQIEYKQGTGAFTLGTGTRVGPTGSVISPYTVTGLAPSMPYSFYVRDICGIGDTSAWSGPVTAFTAFPAIPANDDCAVTPVDISNGALYYGTNAGATQTLAACDATTPTATDVWYTFTTGASAGVLTDSINTSFSGGDVVVQMFSGACGSLTPMVPTAGTTYNTTTGCVDGPAAGMEWSNYSVTANTTYLIRVYAFNATTPGPFSIQITGAPLAIRLDKISATNVGASNRIDWNTLSEESSDKFELERSIDGKNFSRIHERNANGTASRYTYLDNNAVKGMNYYRLRMIAANGSATYSETVSAFVKSSGFEVEAFPNPVSHELTVKVSGVQGADATIQVTDVTGKVIKTVTMNSNLGYINMSGLANGIYLIKYSDADHTQTIRVNKQ